MDWMNKKINTEKSYDVSVNKDKVTYGVVYNHKELMDIVKM